MDITDLAAESKALCSGFERQRYIYMSVKDENLTAYHNA